VGEWNCDFSREMNKFDGKIESGGCGVALIGF